MKEEKNTQTVNLFAHMKTAATHWCAQVEVQQPFTNLTHKTMNKIYIIEAK